MQAGGERFAGPACHRSMYYPFMGRFSTYAPIHSMTPRKAGGPQDDLLKGTLDMLILQALSWGPQHGYGLSQLIRSGSGDVLQAETGSLYPALHRLERRGWIKADWGTSDNNRRAKYYELTRAGRARLDTEISAWRKLSAAVAQVIEST